MGAAFCVALGFCLAGALAVAGALDVEASGSGGTIAPYDQKLNNFNFILSFILLKYTHEDYCLTDFP